MALGYSDERDLILPLFAGIAEAPLWDTFLRRLRMRTGARRMCLVVRAGNAGPLRRVVSAAGDPATFPELDELAEAGLLPYLSLRPNRVYSLDEFITPGKAVAAADSRHGLLEQAGVAHARIIRIPAQAGREAWLIALHDRHDFGAADSVLLSTLAPHFALALNMLGERDALQSRAAIAEQALSLIGVGQAAFDEEGRAIAADAPASAQLNLAANGRPQLRGRAARALNAACDELRRAAAEARRIVRLDDDGAHDMLLRPAPRPHRGLPGGPVAVGLVREPPRAPTLSAAHVIAATHGLSLREAALAEAMSRGESIVEAGARLQLTAETARNYTKRIYAKTGATGQADLVRMVLTGLAPFA